MRCFLALVLTVAGCQATSHGSSFDAGESQTVLDAAGTAGEPIPSGSMAITTVNDDGSQRTVIDATNDASWIYFDIDTGSEVIEAGPWDLAFQRYSIKMNGGVSGPGGVSVSILPGVTFESVMQAPATGYYTDKADSEDTNNPSLVFLSDGGWYEYDVNTHTLSARNQVYVVNSTEGAWFKLRMQSYYRDDNESGGYPSFDWAEVDAPAETASFSVDASAGWTYVNLDANVVVEPIDPNKETNWDIAFNEAQIRTNGGTSASGFGGAQVATTDWDQLASSDSVGYVVDSILPVPGPPGSGDFSGNPAFVDWYDYDFTTHKLSPKSLVFMVRAADGDYFKLRILGYDSGVFTLEAEALTRALKLHTTTFPADAWSVLDFSTGVMGATGQQTWDISINGVQSRTNSGSSGTGMGGALLSEYQTLDAVTEIPRSGCYFLAKGHICECDITADECTEQQGAWTPQCACDVEPTIDSMLPVSGTSGSEEYSGNSVLEGWYDFDDMTPKAAVFILRDAGGFWAKLQFTDYADGAVTATWVWAGPGRFDF